MSHTFSKLNVEQFVPASLTIIDYTSGGEAVTLNELGAAGIDGAIFGQVPPAQNSLGVPLFPILNAGKVVLIRFVGGVPTEIPTTVGLNALVFALVHSTGLVATT